MILGSLALVLSLIAAPGGGDTKSKAPIYDEKANAGEQVDAAIARAKRDNKRVLIQWGANWCGWCHKLHELCGSDPDIAKELLYEYEVVLVDVGKFDKNLDLAKRFEAPFKDHGIPWLTVLDADGKALVQKDSGELESGDHHEPAKVLDFLKANSAKPQDAEQVLAAAFAQAKSEQKLAFVHFGAPWCPWCRRLDAWVAEPDVAQHLGKRAVEVKIDVDRMTNGKDVLKRFRAAEQGGIPWFAFVDADGKTIGTSDGPKGNLGFPGNDEEIAAFGALLAKAGVAADDSTALQDSLKKIAVTLKQD